MKKLILSIVAIATLSLSSFGQSPEGFKYQAVVRDAGNLILNNQAVGMQMVIQQGSIGGTTVYTETFAPTTNGYGLVNLEIGTGTTTDDFTIIDWANGPYFIETAVDVTGGTSYTVMGTSQLMSVPYALYAKTSGNGAGPIGPQGPAGATGATGSQGPIGLTGATGPAGATGAQGLAGNDGVGIAQTLSQTGSDVTLSDGGGTVSVNDADADATNELQNLSVSAAGDTLYLQNGGFVIIPGISAANAPVQLATLTTSAVSSLINISATSGGNITDDGGANITTRGVCYSINTNPTTADNITNDGNGTGSFTSNLSGLTASTTYYLRAYAINSAGTAYGNELIFTTLASAALAIGDSYQGGFIFYLDGLGGGLIAAPTNQSTSAPWGCYGTTISGADGIVIGTGNQNTIDIEAGCSTFGTAADICANLVLSGYTDWFLPSKDELSLMYQNIGPGNALGLGNVGGFALNYYWSSTEGSNFLAWGQNFSVVNQNGNGKVSANYVRAVRAF